MVEPENETNIKNLKLEKRKNKNSTNPKKTEEKLKIKNRDSKIKQNEIIILTRISCQLMVVCQYDVVVTQIHLRKQKKNKTQKTLYVPMSIKPQRVM